MRSVIGSVGEFDDVGTAVQFHYHNLIQIFLSMNTIGERVKNVFQSSLTFQLHCQDLIEII